MYRYVQICRQTDRQSTAYHTHTHTHTKCYQIRDSRYASSELQFFFLCYLGRESVSMWEINFDVVPNYIHQLLLSCPCILGPAHCRAPARAVYTAFISNICTALDSDSASGSIRNRWADHNIESSAHIRAPQDIPHAVHLTVDTGVPAKAIQTVVMKCDSFTQWQDSR